MSNKTSKVVTVTFNQTWNPPGGGAVHYHSITFENGDTGTIGRNSQNPSDMIKDSVIEYTVKEPGKLKFVKSISSPSSGMDTQKISQYTSKKPSYSKSKEDFLGFSYGYAKDMVIAGKTSEQDIKDLKKIAEGIYSHICDLLDGKFTPSDEENPF
jgi:hypothetical protein